MVDFAVLYSIFLFVVMLSGASGGLLQALRSKTTYRLRLPSKDNSTLYWDLGFLGFVIAGSLAAVLSVGLLTMSGSADFSAITNKHLNGTPEKTVPIPESIFVDKHQADANDINQLIEILVQHNKTIEDKHSNGNEAAFWSWMNLVGIAMLSGFGGVAFVSAAYNKYVNEEDFEDIENKVKEDHIITTQNYIEISLQVIRDYIKSEQYQAALDKCNEVSKKAPNHPRILGNKARAYRWLNQLDDAIKCLNDAFDKSDMNDSVKARLLLNLCCYKTLKLFEGLDRPYQFENITEELKELKNILEDAISKDRQIIRQIQDDDDLAPLRELSGAGLNWFDDLLE